MPTDLNGFAIPDVTTKADKVSGATNGNIATLNSSGNLLDGGANLASKANTSALTAHTSNVSNPHSTTAAQVGAYTTSQVDTALTAKADLSGATFTGDIQTTNLNTTGVSSTLNGITLFVNDFVSDSTPQIVCRGSTEPALRLQLGIETTSDFGYLQALNFEAGSLPLHLNPAGGQVSIGDAVVVSGPVTATSLDSSGSWVNHFQVQDQSFSAQPQTALYLSSGDSVFWSGSSGDLYNLFVTTGFLHFESQGTCQGMQFSTFGTATPLIQFAPNRTTVAYCNLNGFVLPRVDRMTLTPDDGTIVNDTDGNTYVFRSADSSWLQLN